MDKILEKIQLHQESVDELRPYESYNVIKRMITSHETNIRILWACILHS